MTLGVFLGTPPGLGPEALGTGVEAPGCLRVVRFLTCVRLMADFRFGMTGGDPYIFDLKGFPDVEPLDRPSTGVL